MKRFICAALLPMLMAIAASARTPFNFQIDPIQVTAVSFVDLNRYAGKWFEIAYLPNKFQKDCVGNTTATYTLTPNGTMEVLNRCLKKNGAALETKGTAQVTDSKTNAKFKISLFNAPYWIIDLDPNYNYAVVGNPERKNLWILSRSPQMDDATYQNTLRRVERMGYDPNKLTKTSQKNETVKGAMIEKQ